MLSEHVGFGGEPKGSATRSKTLAHIRVEHAATTRGHELTPLCEELEQNVSLQRAESTFSFFAKNLGNALPGPLRDHLVGINERHTQLLRGQPPRRCFTGSARADKEQAHRNLCRSSQKVGYDLLTHPGSITRMPGWRSDRSPKAMAMR